MFTNKRTGAKAKELRGYDSESEADAKRRLEAAGWEFGGVDFTFDDDSKLFKVSEAGDKMTKPAGVGDE
jgi:hypothetical protein